MDSLIGGYINKSFLMPSCPTRLQDGFFDGELLDGRRGLVPSNFVEKLVGEDLVEFHQSVVMGLRDDDEPVSTSVPSDLNFISQDESHMMIGKLERRMGFVDSIVGGWKGWW